MGGLSDARSTIFTRLHQVRCGGPHCQVTDESMKEALVELSA
jgi:hypothetical protein